MKELGPFIKAAREHLEITIREAEEISGISNAYLSQIENGKIKKPSQDTINKLSRLYQVSYEMLMHKAGYPLPDYGYIMGEDSENMITVLIVDDSSQDRELIRSHLINDTPLHFTITETGSGEEALQVASKNIPDCILLDYHLPDMDGLAVFEQIKLINALKYTSVIILTGNGSEETAVRAMRMGAVNYLNKDAMTRENLINAVRHAIKRKHLRESIYLRSEKAHHDVEGFTNSLRDIAEEIAAAAERIIKKNENLVSDPDMNIILGKSKELLALEDGQGETMYTGKTSTGRMK